MADKDDASAEVSATANGSPRTTSAGKGWDAFISYRRSDGAQAASWLRRRLKAFRPPPSLEELTSRDPLTLYLDTVYERASPDFYRDTIAPALDASRHLVVVVTRAALQPLPDGSENWVAREIRDFCARRDEPSVIPVVIDGDLAGPLPGNLRNRFQHLQLIDLRALRGVRQWFSPATRERLADEVVKIAGLLLNVRLEDMPALRQEEAKLRAARNLRVAMVTAILAVGFLALAVFAAWSSYRAERQRRFAVSRQLAVISAGLRAEQLDRALLLAAASYRLAPTAEASNALIEALQWSPRLSRHLHRHQNRVSAIAVHPDGRRFATVDDDGVLALWDDLGDAQGPPQVKGGLEAVAFSRDGGWLAAAGLDGDVLTWRPADWSPPCPPLHGGKGPVTSLAFLRSGELLAGEFQGAIRRWNVRACRDDGVVAHDARGPVYRIAASAQGAVLLSAHGDGSILEWREDGGTLIPSGKVAKHEDGAFDVDVDVSEDASVAVSGGGDGAALHDLEHPEAEPARVPGRSVAVALSGAYAAAATGAEIQVMDLSGRIVETLKTGRAAHVSALAFVDGGRRLIAGSRDGALQIFSISSGEPGSGVAAFAERLEGVRGRLDDASAASAAAPVAVVTAQGVIPGVGTNPCATDAKPRRAILNAGGTELAVADEEGGVTRFLVPSCREVSRMNAGGDVLALAFTRTGLSGVTYEGILFPSGRRVAAEPVVSAAFSADASRLAIAGGGAIRVADRESGEPVWETGSGGGENAVAFAPADDILISGGDDRTLHFWRASTGQALDAIAIPERRIFSAAVSVRGIAAVGHDDGTVQLWDARTRTPLGAPLSGHQGFVVATAFSRDGATLYSSDEEGRIIAWRTRPEDLVSLACARAGRELRPDEWRRFLPDEDPVPVCGR